MQTVTPCVFKVLKSNTFTVAFLTVLTLLQMGRLFSMEMHSSFKYIRSSLKKKKKKSETN